MARIVILGKGLGDRVEIVPAKTRRENSAYYEINPSGRVPFLVTSELEGGNKGFEESAPICRHLDALDGAPRFDRHPRDGRAS